MKHARFFCAVALFLFLALSVYGADNGSVTVSKDVARVLLMPYGDAKTLGIARKGDHLKVLSKNGEWYNVEFNGSIGWIFQANVEPAETAGSPPPPRQAKPTQPSVPSKQAPFTAPPPIQSQQAPASAAPLAAQQAPGATPQKPQAVQQNPVPAIVKPQPSAEPAAQRYEEKQEPFGEQAPKKVAHKQRKQQNVTVDLPPASVMPITGTKELSAYPPETASVSGKPASPSKSSAEKAGAQPQPGEQKQQAQQKYFEITESPAKVLASVSPESPILGIARNSECYPLLYTGTSWCKIQFGNSPGWIDRRYGRIVDAPTSVTNIHRIVLYASVGGVAVILLVLVIVLVVISLRNKSARKVAVKKDLLIIAKSEKQMQYSLSDATTTMSKCFSEIGFDIQSTSSFEHAANLLGHYEPDVIVVDWQLDNRALPLLESIFTGLRSATDTLVIFYNVPDAEVMRKPDAFTNAHFLGLAFSDRDIFKLVTPIILSKSGTKAIRKSVETSALGGEIGQGSLIEVMQFIEIGRKTGCLYVVIDRPFGLIYFEQGRLSYAATQTQQGREAVFEMLNLKKGHFHFVLDKTSQTKNVDLSTLEILMEWTKTVDEAHRH